MTPLSRARGLGSAKQGVHHWWAQRITAVALIPLVVWFAISLIMMSGADYFVVRAWIGSPVVMVLLTLTIVIGLHHGQLGMQEVVEDATAKLQQLCPGLRFLGILGLYSLFLLYLGLPTLMKVPQEKALSYTVVVIVAAIVLFMVIGLVAGSFVAMPMGA